MSGPAKKRLSPADQALADIEAEEQAERTKKPTAQSQDSRLFDAPEVDMQVANALEQSFLGNPIMRLFGTGLTSGFAPKLAADIAGTAGPNVPQAPRGDFGNVKSPEEVKVERERAAMAETDEMREGLKESAGGGFMGTVASVLPELAGGGVQAYLGGRALGASGLAPTVQRLANPIMQSLGRAAPLARAASVGAAMGAPAGVGYGDPGRPVGERALEGGAAGAVAGGVLGEAVQSVLNPILGGIRSHGQKAWQKMQQLSEPGGEQVKVFAEAGGLPAKPLPAALGGEEGTFRPTPAMKSTMERAQNASSGAGSAGELAYDEITSDMLARLEKSRKNVVDSNAMITEGIAQRSPRPISVEPLRDHINAALAKFHTADVPASARAASARRRANIQGATPGEDYASLGPEYDIAFSSAPTLRRVADSLLRPAETSYLSGGSSAERSVAAATQVGRRGGRRSGGSAAVDELADDAVEANAVADAESASRRKQAPPQERYADYNIRNYVQLRQEIDDLAQYESGRHGPGVAALRALGAKVREIISQNVSSDDFALIEKQSKDLATMNARLRTFGVSGRDKLDLTLRGKDWAAVNAALKGDTRAMRDEALTMGPGALRPITQARGTAAYEGLEKGTAGNEQAALGSMALAASGSRLAMPAAVRGALMRPRRAGLMHVNPIMAPTGGMMFSGAQGGRMSQKKDEEKRP